MGYTNNTFSSYFRRINSRKGREKLFVEATFTLKEIVREFLFPSGLISAYSLHGIYKVLLAPRPSLSDTSLFCCGEFVTHQQTLTPRIC